MAAKRSQHNSSSISVQTSAVTHAPLDDEYKSAIQPVVDNNMRTDILGSHFCRVLENHTPASKAILALITKEVLSDPDLKDAIKKVIKENNDETKVQWINRGIGAIGAIIIGVLIWFIEHLLTTQTAVAHH